MTPGLWWGFRILRAWHEKSWYTFNIFTLGFVLGIFWILRCFNVFPKKAFFWNVFPLFFLKTLEGPLCLHGERKATRVNIIHQFHPSSGAGCGWLVLCFTKFTLDQSQSLRPQLWNSNWWFFVGKRDPCWVGFLLNCSFKTYSPIQGGPLLVINGVTVTPINGLK